MAFKTTSLADQIFDKLESDIVLGVYRRGEILTELKLAEQMGVSRTPIREALHRLAQEHLLLDTGKGSMVLGVSKEDLLDIMDIRLHLEGLVARYAAQNITQEQLQELRYTLELQDFYLSKKDTEHIQTADDSFHALLCRCSGRMMLTDTLMPLYRKIQRYRKASIATPDRIGYMVEEHHRIYEAVAARDAAAAEHFAMEHIANARENMFERINEDGNDTGSKNH